MRIAVSTMPLFGLDTHVPLTAKHPVAMLMPPVPYKLVVAVVKFAMLFSERREPGEVVPIPTLPVDEMVTASVPPPLAAVKKPRFDALSDLRENVDVPTLITPAHSAFHRALEVPRSKTERLLVYGPLGRSAFVDTVPFTESVVHGVDVPNPRFPVVESKRNCETPALPNLIVEEALRPPKSESAVEVAFVFTPKFVVGVKGNGDAAPEVERHTPLMAKQIGRAQV